MVEYFPGKDGQWYWRFRAKNGQVSATGNEGYATKWNAKRAARRIGISMAFAKAVEVSK